MLSMRSCLMSSTLMLAMRSWVSSRALMMSLKVVHFESTESALVRIDLVVGEDISAPAAEDFLVGVVKDILGAGEDTVEAGGDISAAKEDFLGVTEEIFEAAEDIMEAADFFEEGDIHSAGEGMGDS